MIQRVRLFRDSSVASRLLLEASEQGNVKLLRCLLSSGQDPQVAFIEDCEALNAGYFALRNEDYESLSILVEYGFDINKDPGRGDHLIFAANTPEKMRVLLSLGVDVDVTRLGLCTDCNSVPNVLMRWVSRIDNRSSEEFKVFMGMLKTLVARASLHSVRYFETHLIIAALSAGKEWLLVSLSWLRYQLVSSILCPVCGALLI